MNVLRLVLAISVTLFMQTSYASEEACGSVWQEVPIENLATKPLTDELRVFNFQTAFTVTSPTLSPGETWDHVVFRIRQWLEQVSAIRGSERGSLRDLFDGKPLSRNMQLESSEDGKLIVFQRSEEAGPAGRPRRTALLFEHQGQHPGTYWRTHIGLQFDEDNRLRMTVAVLNWSSNSQLLGFQLSSPRIIKTLLEDKRLVLTSGGVKLHLSPMLVDASNSEEVLSALNDQNRILPIVIVLRDQTRSLPVDMKRLGDRLAGQAIVYAEGAESIHRFVTLPFNYKREGQIFIVGSSQGSIRSVNLRKFADLDEDRRLFSIVRQVTLRSTPDIETEMDKWANTVWTVR